jgi:UDP-GlcNAc:undecaprenyl-phosphate/decaprenyl-phosphate GlcNAc-1-phosphate transferase
MRSERWLAPNHRGRKIPRLLWLPLALGGVAAGAIGALDPSLLPGPLTSSSAAGVALAGSMLVLVAGIVDDLVPQRVRGLGAHVRALAEGRVTTGVLKLIIAVGAGVVVVAAGQTREAWVRGVGVVVIAGCANLWNGLDVAPGRAIKVGLLLGGIVLGVGLSRGAAWAVAAPTWGVLLGALVALPLDLRERAMLGDGGSNLLGFAVGLGAYAALPPVALGITAAAVVGLNVLADTVSLSRVIQGTAPLRWLDDLGRIQVR